MTKLVQNDLASLTNEQSALAALNSNYASLEAFSDSVLSRDGTVPNQMNVDLDMNSNQILNLPQPVNATEPLRLQDLTDFLGLGTVTTGIQAPIPAVSTDNAIIRWDGVAGNKAQNSAITISDNGGMTIANASSVLLTLTENDAVTEMVNINSSVLGQAGIVFRFGGVASPALSIKDGSENQLTQLTANGQAFFTGPVKFGNNFTNTIYGNVVPRIQVVETTDTSPGIMSSRFTADANGANFYIIKSRNATAGSHTIVQNNDELGQLAWGASDGTGFLAAGAVGCFVDGTPGTNDMPTRMVFQLTADGAASYVPRMVLTTTALVPATNDAMLLGSTSLMWSDLFLASGGVINFNNGNMTLSHSANQLTITGSGSAVLAITDGTVVQQFAPSGGAIAYAGTTSNHPVGILVNNSEKWRFQADGVVLPLTDNSFNIGTSSFRPRDIYCSRDFFRPGGTQAIIRTSAGITSGAGASTGTLTNAPAVGNPTSWVPINDNGTTRYIPAW